VKKYPKVKRIGHSVNEGIFESDNYHLHVQEKLDGANFRFTLQRNIEEEYHDPDRDLVFGSRNNVYKNERDRDDSFTHAIEYVRKNVDLGLLEQYDTLHGELTFFGEAMHPHTLDYDWDETPSFLGFDIYSGESSEFLNPNEVRELYGIMGLPHVPVLSPAVIEDEFECPDSQYHDGLAEGVVIKNTETGQRAKIRGEKFKEMHPTQSAVNNEGNYDPADAVVLANQFATEARILKMIHKYENRGRDIGMGVMEDLWRDVFDDIIEEEYETIFLGDHTLNTKDFRSEVASNTAGVLQTYLNRPDDSVLNEVSA
jgi:hypothetical protein